MNKFENVKVGDKVFLSERNPWGDKILVVEHVTKTQLKAGGTLWRRKDGYRVGRGDWDFTTIEPYNPAKHDEIINEMRAALARTRKQARIRDMKVRDLTDAQLDAIIGVLDAVPQEVTP